VPAPLRDPLPGLDPCGIAGTTPALRLAIVVVLAMGVSGVMVASVPIHPPGRSNGSGGGFLDAIRGLVGSGKQHTGPYRPRSTKLTEGAVPRADALPAAKKWPPAKRVKELPDRRTANATFYQLSDGRTQAEISAVGKDLARGAVTPGGISSGVVGGAFPSTRDDVVSYVTSRPSFGTSNLINVFGGMLGGGFE
jgi:hypothetical protein